jgi:hypothetical protein
VSEATCGKLVKGYWSEWQGLEVEGGRFWDIDFSLRQGMHALIYGLMGGNDRHSKQSRMDQETSEMNCSSRAADPLELVIIIKS